MLEEGIFLLFSTSNSSTYALSFHWVACTGPRGIPYGFSGVMLWGAGFVGVIAFIHGKVGSFIVLGGVRFLGPCVGQGEKESQGRGCARERMVKVRGTELFEDEC